jgi:hypothetical protein
MFKVKHATMVFISGLVWLIVGCALLPLGLNFITEGILNQNHLQNYPILNFLAPYSGGIEQAALILIVFALAIGFLKGRFVFAKSVQRSVNRILSLPNPAKIHHIYSLSYYLLLGSMLFLGFLVKFLPIDLRGIVDVIIGSGLINGAVLYFRQAWALRQQPKTEH